MPTEEDIQIHKKWLDEDGLNRLIAFDFLTPDSYVWEIGGYQGWWIDKISKKYDPWITVFEPVIEYWVKMNNRFKDNSKIRLENYGLGNRDRQQDIGLSEDGSGAYCQTNINTVLIKAVDKVLGECLEDIDLMQCNCEGGEYEIFPLLIKKNLMKRFNLVIIQFHNLHKTHPMIRINIQKGLSKTHKQIMCYDWKFEYWKRK